MKWLDKLFGQKNTVEQPAPLVDKEALKRYMSGRKTPFSAEDIIDRFGCNPNLVYGTLGGLNRGGKVKFHHQERLTGTPSKYRVFYVGAMTKPASARNPIGNLIDVIRHHLNSIDGEFTQGQVQKAIREFYPASTGGSFARGFRRMMASGEIVICGGAGVKGDPYRYRKYPKVQVQSKPIPTPTLTSQPITVPFYYDGEYRLVAKRDKRLITLIEQKRTDAMGQEKWEPAETNVRLYQQALKAVCGHLLAPNGVL